jgi:hypothetical protein
LTNRAPRWYSAKTAAAGAPSTIASAERQPTMRRLLWRHLNHANRRGPALAGIAFAPAVPSEAPPSGLRNATAAVVRARDSFGAEQSWEGSRYCIPEERSPAAVAAAVANQKCHAQAKRQSGDYRQPRAVPLAHRPGDAAVPPGPARPQSAWRCSSAVRVGGRTKAIAPPPSAHASMPAKQSRGVASPHCCFGEPPLEPSACSRSGCGGGSEHITFLGTLPLRPPEAPARPGVAGLHGKSCG